MEYLIVWLPVFLLPLALFASLFSKTTRSNAYLTIALYLVSGILAFPLVTGTLSESKFISFAIYFGFYFGISALSANAIAYAYFVYRNIVSRPILEQSVLSKMYWSALLVFALLSILFILTIV